MPSQKTEGLEGSQVSPKRKKLNKKSVIITIVVLLLVVGGVVAGYQLGKNSKEEVKQETTQGAVEDSAKKVDQTAGSIQPSDISYKATVGKFTLTIPSKYIIVKELDGGAEGGPATMLVVGDKSLTDGVVDSQWSEKVSVNAHSLYGGSFKEAVESTIKDRDPVRKADIVVGGLTARVYDLGGLAAPKVVMFSKDDLVYTISLEDKTEATEAKLQSIIEGFKFD